MESFLLILITGIGLGALYFLLASGLSLIYGLMGVLNFAHGAFLTVGAYIGLWVSTKIMTGGSTLTLIAAMLIGGIGAGIFAIIVEQLVITRLYGRHIDQALVTVGVALVTAAVLSGWFSSDPLMIPTPAWFFNSTNVGGAAIQQDRFLYIAVALFLLLLFISILKFTRIGLVIRAGVENRSMVTALGINVRLAFSTVFFMGGFAAGIGGVLIGAYIGGVTPHMSATWLIYGFIVVVIGGLGSLGGSALAALLIGVTKQFANFYLTGLGDFVVVLLLVLVLLLKPEGLLGKAKS